VTQPADLNPSTAEQSTAPQAAPTACIGQINTGSAQPATGTGLGAAASSSGGQNGKY
jgi:hypothetical protein